MMARRKFRSKNAIYFIAYILILGIFVIWGAKHIKNNWIISASEQDLIKVRAAIAPLQELQEENAALKEKLDWSAKVAAPENIRELSKFYIHKYFGNDADRVIKVMTCESGLSNTAVHTNKPGLGADYGLYQLNDKWHRARFEKMFGVKFEVGALDFDLASRYAKFMFDNSKGLSPWVCNRIT